MKSKYLYKLFLFTFLLVPILTLAQALVPREALHNHFEVILPRGDRATADLTQSGDFIMMPFTTNREYVHNCWANWKFDEKKQMLKISGAKRCRILNGEYRVLRHQEGFLLKEGLKQLVLKYIHSS